MWNVFQVYVYECFRLPPSPRYQRCDLFEPSVSCGFAPAPSSLLTLISDKSFGLHPLSHLLEGGRRLIRCFSDCFLGLFAGFLSSFRVSVRKKKKKKDHMSHG